MSTTTRVPIVLYNPTAVFHAMPLALMAVGSALDPAAYEVRIVDGRLDDRRRLREALEGALCLGISVLTGAPIRDALEVSRLARALRPDLPIIWGGWHPSLFPRMCLDGGPVSAVVVGQGERPFQEIVARLARGERDLGGIPGCLTVADADSGVPAPRELVELGELAPLSYGLIDVERYFRAKGQRQLDYISSQGCRFRCNFCADPAVYGRGWSGLPAERVVEEVAALWRRHRFDDLSFQDETYFTYAPRVNAIAEGFLRAGVKTTWFGTLRADQGRRLDEAILRTCKRSGLRRVMIGLEAGSQETIDAIQKDIQIDDVWRTAEKLLRNGVGAVINVIVGFPGEPPASVAETIRVATELRKMSPAFELAIFHFKPYPGNPIAERLTQEGYAFPGDLEGWAGFDYVGARSEWLSPEQARLIDGFRFYQRIGWSDRGGPLSAPLKLAARARVARGMYRFPVERRLIEWLRPGPAMA